MKDSAATIGLKDKVDDLWLKANTIADREYMKARKAGEKMAVSLFGKPDRRKGYADICSPPKKPVTVKCAHCGKTYSSSEMVYEYRPDTQAHALRLYDEEGYPVSPLWWCRDPWCDGGGFKHDIWPVKK
jgi:hypothetical protein